MMCFLDLSESVDAKCHNGVYQGHEVSGMCVTDNLSVFHNVAAFLTTYHKFFIFKSRLCIR